MNRESKDDRETKREVVWALRDGLFWPAEIQQETVDGPAVWLKYLGAPQARPGQHAEPTFAPADASSTLPFLQYFQNFSRQRSDRTFVRAVAEAVNLCRHRRGGREWSAGRHESAMDTNPSRLIAQNKSDRTTLPSEERLEQYVGQDDDDDSGGSSKVLSITSNSQSVLRRNLPVRSSRRKRRLSPDDRDNANTPLNNGSGENPLCAAQLHQEQPSAQPQPSSKRKKKGGAQLVGKKVTIASGRYKGEVGFVVRGANGYYCVEVNSASAAAAGRQRGKGSAGQVWKRASDLRILSSENGNADDDASSSARQSPGQADPASWAARNRDAGSGSGSGSATDVKSSWFDRKVLVKSGKFQGKFGTVVRSGHGFYCVNIRGIGDVMKRASDLQLADEEDKPHGGGSEPAAKRIMAAQVKQQQQQQQHQEQPLPRQPKPHDQGAACALPGTARPHERESLLDHYYTERTVTKVVRQNGRGDSSLKLAASILLELMTMGGGEESEETFSDSETDCSPAEMGAQQARRARAHAVSPPTGENDEDDEEEEEDPLRAGIGPRSHHPGRGRASTPLRGSSRASSSSRSTSSSSSFDGDAIPLKGMQTTNSPVARAGKKASMTHGDIVTWIACTM
mmetsp:Transcript_18564/g.35528  ORF Transcript_18564/g.35528 Transcript_18564/m.35528 type:complete len:624 (-) Transcript_18564:83-1954(-)